MYALSLTGGPHRPSTVGLLAALILIIVTLPGCGTQIYREVGECVVVSPPDAGRYIQATPDEQLVMMTDSYIDQVKAVNKCNNQIVLMNARNKATSAD